MDYPNHGYFAIGFIQPKETNVKCWQKIKLKWENAI